VLFACALCLRDRVCVCVGVSQTALSIHGQTSGVSRLRRRTPDILWVQASVCRLDGGVGSGVINAGGGVDGVSTGGKDGRVTWVPTWMFHNHTDRLDLLHQGYDR
jgi:hypothetical protein